MGSKFTSAVIFASAIGALLIAPIFLTQSFFVQKEVLISRPPRIVWGFITSSRMIARWVAGESASRHDDIVFGGPDSGEGSYFIWNYLSWLGGPIRADVAQVKEHESVIVKVLFEGAVQRGITSQFLVGENQSGSSVRWIIRGESTYFERLLMLAQATTVDRWLESQMTRCLQSLAALSSSETGE